MTHNLFGHNDDMSRVHAVIAREKPEIIALQEFFPEQSRKLDSLLRVYYPHVARCQGGKRANIAIYSRLPFVEVDVSGDCSDGTYGSSQRTARILAVVQTADGTRFSVMTTHLDRPVPVERQTGQFAELASAVTKVKGPLMLAGDFNSTPWSYALRDFAMYSKLQCETRNVATFPQRIRIPAARRYFPDGLVKTMPVLPLDHVLTRGIMVHEVHSGEDTGSDHLPIIVSFSIAEPRSSPAP